MAEPVSLPLNYPQRWESDVVLSDGGTVHVRPIRPEDAERVVAFHGAQSAESIYYRFFSPRPRLSEREVARFTQVDYVGRLAFVALLGPDLIGVARYDCLPPDDGGAVRAEVAFFIDDRHHGRGLGTLLLEYLAVAATEADIDGFVATVLPENRAMINVFRRAGFVVTTRFEDGVVEVTLSTRPTAAGLVSIDQRQARAQAASVARLLNPATVAVIGAGRRSTSLGQLVLRQLVEGDFNGSVHPVNPHATHIHAIRAYPELAAVPDEIDLAVLAVPPDQLLAVLDACAAKGVEGLVVLTDLTSGSDHAGESENGESENGERAEESGAAAELVRQARRRGMRLIGPASIGVINHAADVRLLATFAPVVPGPGRVALSTQSGSMGNAILSFAAECGLGLSSFVNLGEKADVSGNDLLQYWSTDPATAVIALYLESFGNPRRFFSIARQVGRDKPVVVMRTAGLDGGVGRVDSVGRVGGVDQVGGAAQWPGPQTMSALLDRAGVIETTSLLDLFGVARLLASQPLPQGSRVMVVANNAGSAALASHTLGQAGLRPGAAVVRDDVDALAEVVSNAAFDPVADNGVDAVLLVYAPALARSAVEVASSIETLVAQHRGALRKPADGPGTPPRPILTCYLAGSAGASVAGEGDLPRYRFPEDAARALALVAHHSQWRAQPEGEVVTVPDADLDAVRATVAAALRRPVDPDRPVDPVRQAPDPDAAGPEVIADVESSAVRQGEPESTGSQLALEEAVALLTAVGLTPVEQRRAVGLDDALRVAQDIGYPVALKALRRGRLARSVATGMALGLHDGAELTDAYRTMARQLAGSPGAELGPVVVQAMAEPGVDVQVIGHQDDRLGALVALGRGGAQGEDPHQLAVQSVPLRSLDPARLIAASSVATLLDRLSIPAPGAGPSPAPAVGSWALRDLVARLSFLLEQVPEVVSIRLDPLLVSAGGVAITDVVVRVAPLGPRPLPAVRRLG